MFKHTADINVESRPALVVLQFYRGIAALVVVMFHATLITRKYGADANFGRIFLGGDTGVPFFFVLSGFVIAYAQAGKGTGFNAAGQFLKKRFRRIYLPYWVICVVLAPVVVLPSGLPVWELLAGFIAAILLLPSSVPPFVGVAWTLVHEVLFYAFFAAVVLLGRGAWRAFVLWQILVICNWALGWTTHGSAWHYFLSPLNLLFALGLLAYRLPPASGSMSRVAFIVGNLLFFGVMFFSLPAGDIPFSSEYSRAFTSGVGAFLIIWGGTQPSVESHLRPAVAKLGFLGDASYAIYLVHYPILSIFGKISANILQGAFFYFPAVLASIGAGLGFHFIVEKRLIKT